MVRKRRAWRWQCWPLSGSVQQRKEEQLQLWEQSLGQQPPELAGWKELLDGAGQGLAIQVPSPLPLTCPCSPHSCKCSMQALGHPKLPQPCSAHQHCSLKPNSYPHAHARTKRMPGMNWPLQSPQLFHSLPFFFFFPACLSYFFCFFFCLGILSTPAKEEKKKINNREKLRAVLADCSGRFVCSNPIVLGSCCSLLPTAPSWLLTPDGGTDHSVPAVAGRPRSGRNIPPPSHMLMFQSERWTGAWQGRRKKKNPHRSKREKKKRRKNQLL